MENMEEKARRRYEAWLADEALPAELRDELLEAAGDPDEITDRFWQPLTFGTGGMRGVIGAGTNRMNVLTVQQATQGLAEHLCSLPGTPGVVIGFDSRLFSREFALAAACVLCANGIRAWLFDALCPVPEVSFAVHRLGAAAGIMITASHNPREYNGYKVYGADGCQITPPQDREILACVRRVQKAAEEHPAQGIRTLSPEDARAAGLLCAVPPDLEDAYIAALKTQSVHPDVVQRMAKDFTIVYTPLNGTGNRPVRRILKELGFTNVHVVPEQEQPDGRFPTLPFPNPEVPEAFDLALALAAQVQADIVLATDPDADRLGVCCRQEFPDGHAEYIPFTGNMSGALMADYVLRERKTAGTLPPNPVLAQTIVTTDLGKAVAEAHGVSWIEVLTGFKYIGEKMGQFENGTLTAADLRAMPNAFTAPETDDARPLSFVFGLEESYGCMAGTHARDKDACVAVMLLCEAAAWYKTKGMTLWDAMCGLYESLGYYREGARSLTKKGPEGAVEIAATLERVRSRAPAQLGGRQVLAVRDYRAGCRRDLVTGEETPTGLPESNVLYYELSDGAWAALRPSGTEPKIKFYYGVRGTSAEDAERQLKALGESLLAL